MLAAMSAPLLGIHINTCLASAEQAHPGDGCLSSKFPCMCENHVCTAQAAKLIAKQQADHSPSSVGSIGLPAACDQALQGICQLYAIARLKKSWQIEAGTQFPDFLLQKTQW